MTSVDIASPRSPFDPSADSLLGARLSRLWRRCLLPGAISSPGEVWSALRSRYAEPHRHYHDKNHLAHCLAQLDLAKDQIEQLDQVELAIWFHDVINDPGRDDNEARSAAFFRDMAAGVMDEGLVDSVVDLILVTTHREMPSAMDQCFICDIDLSSFGCPWECYMRDTQKVKAEFQGPAEDYYRGKKGFLEAMLRRPKIFQTDFFHARYEQQARENIGRLLALMDRGQY